MIVVEFGESAVLGLWVLVIVVYLVLGMRGNEVSKASSGASASPRSGRGNGFIPSSFRAISSYLRIVSSGASTVARSAASVASSIVDRDDESSRDQVLWAGFDKLESEGEIRRVLLLAYRSGFQVWDVEEAENVRDLASRNDGPVSFMQMIPNSPMKRVDDKFVESRPLLVVCTDCSGGTNYQDGFTTQCNGNIPSWSDQGNGCFVPTAVRFYSLKSQTYVHVLKFRSAVYSVRCSSQVVAISQVSQIHCFDATTLERVYTILTSAISSGSPGSGGVGYGPLAVGPRWLAYSGAPVLGSNPGRVTPQHLTPSANLSSYPSNGSLVAHYAKESSKQLAAGIVTLGDMGYKKLSRYCSERLSDSSNSPQSVSAGGKGSGVINGHVQEADNVGVVVVRDFVSKSVVVQFRAHKSPISALCFDPSGTLLVTASVQGHNINVFKIMPGHSGSATSDAGDAIHLYRLQRGVTNAVIQDISFSDDSNWIMVSSSRGTSHLFALCPYGGLANFQAVDSFTARNNGLSFVNKTSVRWLHDSDTQIDTVQGLCAKGSPVTLSAISRIRNGNGWRGTVSGAAAAATGRGNFLAGAIASSFHNCKGNVSFVDKSYLKAKCHLLVFSPSGSMIQYALRIVGGQDSLSIVAGSNAYEAESDSDGRLVVDAIQKWNVSQKQNRREREENFDIYGENGNVDSKRIYPEGMIKGNCFAPGTEDVSSKPRMSSEERNHFYISQAESQVHQAQIPLWAKPGIYFQSILKEGMKSDEESAFGGEMEIERMANRMIEARPKILVPVFDYLQTSKSQHTRVPAVTGNVGQQYSKSGLSARGMVFDGCSPSPLESTTDTGAAVEELNCGFKESASNGHLMPKESKFVNSSGCTDIEREFVDVNNRKGLGEETPVKFVKSNEEALKRENHFQEEGGDELG